MTHPVPPTSAEHFTVATPAVRRSGTAMAEVALEVSRIRVHDELGAVGVAMPGSESAAAAAALARVWQASFHHWVRATELHAGALRRGADDYDTIDDAVATALDDQPPRWPTPRHLRRPGAGS